MKMDSLPKFQTESLPKTLSPKTLHLEISNCLQAITDRPRWVHSDKKMISDQTNDIARHFCGQIDWAISFRRPVSTFGLVINRLYLHGQ